MHLLLDICQGVGLACAVGVRPFAPALVAGGLAAADAGVDFDHTDYAYLEAPWFLALLAVLLVGFVLLDRRRAGSPRLAADLMAGLGIYLGAVLFAGSLADHGHASWPGLLGGAVCAAVALLAVRSLLARVRGRLDAEAAAALPVYAEGAGVAVAGLSVLLPPLGLLALVFFLALLLTGRRRGGEKYAGLRILR